MLKVYIAAAFRRFSKRSDDNRAYGEVVDTKYISLLEKIEEVFLDFGFCTCLPHRDEGMWGKIYYDPGAISALCFRHVQTSDVVFALAEEGRGVHLELGYAAGLGNKQMLLMHREGTEPSTLLRGFSEDASPWNGITKGLTKAVTCSYINSDDLAAKLKTILVSEFGVPRKKEHNLGRTNVAIIDLGSHTIKLKVLSCCPGSYPKPIYAAKESLGIMGDVLQKGAFSTESIDKLLKLLASWQLECKRLLCTKVVVTGTAALRKASNASMLIEAIKKDLSWDLTIISPEKELDYVFEGVKATFMDRTKLAVLNLGGGSTQLGIGDTLTPSERYLFEFGTRQLTEKWPWRGPMSAAAYNELVSYVKGQTTSVLVGKRASSADKMVHTGGELDFMLRCRLPLTISKSSPIHVSEISVQDFSRFSEQFSRLPPDHVAKEFGLDPAWASGSVASNVIALCIAESIGANAIIPSNCNISDGLLYEALHS